VRVVCRTTYSRSVSSVISFTVFPRSQATRIEMEHVSPALLAAAVDQVSHQDAARSAFPVSLARDAHPPAAPSAYHVEYSKLSSPLELTIPLALPNGPAGEGGKSRRQKGHQEPSQQVHNRLPRTGRPTSAAPRLLKSSTSMM
jgi:hypothetical protein